MKPQARLGDRTFGHCSRHEGNFGGTIISCSDNTFINMRGAARLGDQVRADCGCIANITSCSDSVFVNGRGQARLGDSVSSPTYNGNIVTASDNVEGSS